MTTLTRLEGDALRQAIEALPAGWGFQQGPDRIVKQWSFDDFKAAMTFVNKAADVAEAQNHHPDIRIVYNRVGLVLTTHDAKGLTQRDLDFVSTLENI